MYNVSHDLCDKKKTTDMYYGNKYLLTPSHYQLPSSPPTSSTYSLVKPVNCTQSHSFRGIYCTGYVVFLHAEPMQTIVKPYLQRSNLAPMNLLHFIATLMSLYLTEPIQTKVQLFLQRYNLTPMNLLHFLATLTSL